jgi:hypothetical protein
MTGDNLCDISKLPTKRQKRDWDQKHALVSFNTAAFRFNLAVPDIVAGRDLMALDTGGSGL